MIYIITDYILLFSDQLYIYYYFIIIYYTSYMCIHTYSHKDTYIYIYIYIFAHICNMYTYVTPFDGDPQIARFPTIP